jgi:hypothetical protein
MSTIRDLLNVYFDPASPNFSREIAEAVANRQPDPILTARVIQ